MVVTGYRLEPFQLRRLLLQVVFYSIQVLITQDIPRQGLVSPIIQVQQEQNIITANFGKLGVLIQMGSSI